MIQNSDNCKPQDIIENLKEKYITDLFYRASQRPDTYVDYKKQNIELLPDDIKYIAFYLPQFHPIKENDEWWGKGFTEWTNVSKAVPQFVGHHQPHLPGELGFYDLRVLEVLKRQVELAKAYGIFGFCFYFYWFGGKTLLEMPVKNLLENPEIDMSFCLCWANENWTRRWDGNANEILIRQKHSPEDDLAFIEHLLPYLKDKRYIKINYKPVLIVYRPELLPDPGATAELWRNYCRKAGLGEIYLMGAQITDFYDFRLVGFDASVEFPPNHLLVYCSNITKKLPILNPNFGGSIADYYSLVKSRTFMKCEKFSPFKTVFPSWDNTARKPNSPMLLYGSTPELYKEWLNYVGLYTKLTKSRDEQFVFINAWNEWAEGAHLEPDRKYGYAYLQATSEALLVYRAFRKQTEEVLPLNMNNCNSPALKAEGSDSNNLYRSINKTQLLSSKTENKLFPFDENKAREIVLKNKEIFQSKINEVKKNIKDKNFEMASRWAFEAANFAVSNHPGAYTSPELEKLLIECGNHLPKVILTLILPKKKEKRWIFHVMSEGSYVGGHTRLVKNWIEMDTESTHFLITTWQINSMPKWVINAVAKSGGTCISLDTVSESFLARAAVLREITRQHADIVICHMHMHDPIPVIALGIEGGPPVIYLNHGDHVFWLGASISDVVCDVRSAAQRLTLKRRNIKTSCLLPSPLNCPQSIVDKKLARKALGLQEDADIILSIASEYKYNSFSSFDLIDFLNCVLERHNNAKAIIVGPKNEGKWLDAFKASNGRIMAVGVKGEIEDYYSCADIYLDSYMFCSMTSALDAGLRGLPMTYLKNHNNELLSCDDISLDNLNNGFNTTRDYFEYIDRLLTDKEFAEREGKALKEAVKAHHVSLWNDYLNKAYSLAKNIPHTINLRDFKDEIGTEDLFLALFQNQCPS